MLSCKFIVGYEDFLGSLRNSFMDRDYRLGEFDQLCPVWPLFFVLSALSA